jgi:hypothetical protein
MCGRVGAVERHHIFGGAYKKKSEKYGAMIYLCHFCHNEPPNGVHFNKDNMRTLRKQAQAEIMEKYGWSVSDFRRVFGKNYLD